MEHVQIEVDNTTYDILYSVKELKDGFDEEFPDIPLDGSLTIHKIEHNGLDIRMFLEHNEELLELIMKAFGRKISEMN